MTEPKDRAESFPSGPSETPHPESVAGVYERLSDSMIRLAFVMVGDQAAAEDAWHEAFMRASRRLERLRDPHAVDAYVRRALVNEIKDSYRRVQREGRRREQLESIALRESSALGEIEVTRVMVWQAVLALPWRKRCAVVLRYYEGLPERECARVLRCSPRAVNALVARALRDLRATLRVPEGDES